MAEQRDTVGKISLDLTSKNEKVTHSAHDQMQEQLEDYEKNVIHCIHNFKVQAPHLKHFYIVVITKKERLMQNVIRNYFMARQTCPTPEYDQTVYEYSDLTGDLKFMWVVPSKDTCEELKENALNVAPEERQLLKFVLDFMDGTLLKIAKRLNGESVNSPLLVKE